MKLGEFVKRLSEEYFENRSDALEFASFVSGVEYRKIPLHLADEINTDQNTEAMLQRIKSGEPLSYVINNKNFYGSDFFVDSRVLIPRPETEILVEAALNAADGMSGEISILDICTGSGCILATLLKELPGAKGVGVDISEDALQVAERNIQSLHVADRAELICHDALQIETLDIGCFDIITCNPPYLSDEEWDASDKSLKYEPKNALTAGGDALLFYKKLLDTTPELCNKNGVVLFELGIGQYSLMERLGLVEKCHIIKDYQQIERVLSWTNL